MPPRDASFDVGVFAIKANDIRAAAEQVRDAGVSLRVAVSLCNGIEGKSELGLALDCDATECLAGVTYMGAALQADGSIAQTGTGPTVAERPRSVTLPALFPTWEWTDGDVDALLWHKLLANAVINPLTAIWRVRNGALLDSPERLRVATALCDEFMRVADARGVHIDLGAGTAIDLVRAVCDRTAANTSSMRVDVERGRRTEVDFITGAVLRQAELAGLPPPPTHAIMLDLIRGFIHTR